MKPSNAKKFGIIVSTLAVAVLTCITTAQASIVTLKDGNTMALVDVDSPIGMYQWTVDGINHLNQQWFWFRAGQNQLQLPINAIGPANWFQSGPNKLNTIYANATFSVEIDYTLTGGGIGTADIDEGVKIHNSTDSDLAFTFYQYSDFNLLNNPAGDTVLMDNTLAYQWKGATQIAEGIIAPNASAFEANVTGGTSSTLYKLGSIPNLILNNSGSASGDVTWAFQWDLVIPANSDEIITKDKLLNIYVIPEPSAFALIALGLAAVAIRRRA